jgi:CDP-diacylglycerol--serine O-phosphatidyltransferase
MLDNEIRSEDKAPNKRKKSPKKGVYLLPNLLTSVSLFGGFYAIVASFDGNFVYAAIAIIISGVFDCLDGRVARLTGTSSKFGVEYDSLADLIAFGLAPGLLIFTWGLRSFGRYGWLAAFLYVVCAALRLARYNVQVTTIENKRFNGLPVPAAAMLVSSTILLYNHFGLADEVSKYVVVLGYVYLLAFLMVSNIKYHSFKELNLSQRMPFKLLVGSIFLLIAIAAEPPLMLFLLSFLYVMSGPVTTLLDRRRRRLAKAVREEKKDKQELKLHHR